MNILRVSSRSDANAVAGAVASRVRAEGHAEIQTIGAGALNQAVKSLAVARGFLAPSGVDLVCRPAFIQVDNGGNPMTAIRLLVEPAQR